MTWSSRIRGVSQEMTSYFVSLVCKFESLSSLKKFDHYPMSFLPQNGAQSGKNGAKRAKNGAQCLL